MGEQRKDTDEPLSEEEIAAQDGEQLPNREVMSVLTITPDNPVMEGWEPPPNFPANHSIETPPPTD